MTEPVRLRAGILRAAQTPAIRIGAIQQEPRQTFRRRGAADDFVEITGAGIRFYSKPGSRKPFDLRFIRDGIGDAWVERGWMHRHLWLQVGRERHGLAFRRTADLEQAVRALTDLMDIVPR